MKFAHKPHHQRSSLLQKLLAHLGAHQVDDGGRSGYQRTGIVTLHCGCNGRKKLRPDFNAFLAERRTEHPFQRPAHLFAHGFGSFLPYLGKGVADGHPVLLDGIGKLYHQLLAAVVQIHGICQCPCKAHHRAAGRKQLVFVALALVIAQIDPVTVRVQRIAFLQDILQFGSFLQLCIHVLQSAHRAQNAGRDALILRFSCLSAVLSVFFHSLLVGLCTVCNTAVVVDARQQVHAALHPALFILDDRKLRIQLVQRLLCNVILKLQALGLRIQIVVPGFLCAQVAFAVFLPQGLPLLFRLGFFFLLQLQFVLLVLSLPIDLVQL